MLHEKAKRKENCTLQAKTEKHFLLAKIYANIQNFNMKLKSNRYKRKKRYKKPKKQTRYRNLKKSSKVKAKRY